MNIWDISLGYSEALSDSALASLVIFSPTLAIFAFSGLSVSATAIYFMILLAAALTITSFSATTGILSFGHVAFMGFGAHLSALFTMPVAIKNSTLPYLPDVLANLTLPLLPALVITVAVITLLALITGIHISRLGGSEAAIATLALLVISSSILFGARDFTHGSQALFGIPKVTTILVAFGFVVLIIFATRCFTNSRTGLLLRAVLEDEPATVAIDIQPHKMQLRAWVVSGALVGLAGGLLGHFLTVFSPKEFYFDLTFSLLVILILGSFASIFGAIVVAVLVTLFVEVLCWIEQSAQIACLAARSLDLRRSACCWRFWACFTGTTRGCWAIANFQIFSPGNSALRRLRLTSKPIKYVTTPNGVGEKVR